MSCGQGWSGFADTPSQGQSIDHRLVFGCIQQRINESRRQDTSLRSQRFSQLSPLLVHKLLGDHAARYVGLASPPAAIFVHSGKQSTLLRLYHLPTNPHNEQEAEVGKTPRLSQRRRDNALFAGPYYTPCGMYKNEGWLLCQQHQHSDAPLCPTQPL